MEKARAPKEQPPKLNTICASFLIEWIPRIVVLILLISGYNAAIEYNSLLSGNFLSDYHKMVLDYSLTIFAGCSIFLLLYMREMKKIVNHIFNIKEV